MKVAAMRRLYLREATVMLALARVAVRLFPAAYLFAWADRRPRRVRRFAAEQAGWVAWAVETIGARPWMNALCLPRALAAQAMLRRRGIASRLCLGVARDKGELAAHAWIECGGAVIVGGHDAAMFRQLAEFGASDDNKGRG